MQTKNKVAISAASYLLFSISFSMLSKYYHMLTFIGYVLNILMFAGSFYLIIKIIKNCSSVKTYFVIQSIIIAVGYAFFYYAGINLREAAPPIPDIPIAGLIYFLAAAVFCLLYKGLGNKAETIIYGVCTLCIIGAVVLKISSIYVDNSYLNKSDNISDRDKKLIKEFRSHHNYSNDELKSLEIKYLGEVDGYRIYFVPFKGSSGVLNSGAWKKEGYTFPVASHTQIIGIKDGNLYTLGNLIHETSINIRGLYELMPEEFHFTK